MYGYMLARFSCPFFVLFFFVLLFLPVLLLLSFFPHIPFFPLKLQLVTSALFTLSHPDFSQRKVSRET